MVSGINDVLNAVARAPSADNKQPWRFLVGEGSIKICYDRQRASRTKFGFYHPATLLGIGGIVHNLTTVLESSGLDFKAHYHCNATDSVYVEFEVPNLDSSLVVLDQTGCHIRHTNRSSFKKELPPSCVLDAMPRRDLFRWTADRNRIGGVAKLVSEAAEIRLQIKEEHESLMSNLRYTDDEVAMGDGLDIKTIALPPGGELLLKSITDWTRMEKLNRIGAYKVLARLESQHMIKAPVVLELVGKKGVRAGLDAGMALAEVWTYLNLNGLAVHPYFVVSEQLVRARSGRLPSHLKDAGDRYASSAEAFFDLDPDSSLYMLLRVGYPQKVPDVRSRRLALDLVTDFV